MFPHTSTPKQRITMIICFRKEDILDSRAQINALFLLYDLFIAFNNAESR